MRIMMTQRQLIHRGGSELFTIEVASELSQRGHDVSVFCSRVGELAKIMFSTGVVVKDRLNQMPWEPEIIHGQHHLQTVAALSYFLHSPAIYYCHGIFPWVERVPLHARIRKYVMICEWMVLPVKTEFGIPSDQMTFIPNFVNTVRFSHVRDQPDRVRKALLFGISGFHKDELLKLESACTQNGMSLDKIGYGYGNPHPRPEVFLLDYDLVFAVGRSAVEALACGCAVIPIIPGQAGQLVTMQNFEAWRYSNFSPRYYTSAQSISPQWLAAQLRHYPPDPNAQLSSRIRRENNLGQAVDQLESLYKGTADGFDIKNISTRAEFAPYLEKLALEADVKWETLYHLDQQAANATGHTDRIAGPDVPYRAVLHEQTIETPDGAVKRYSRPEDVTAATGAAAAPAATAPTALPPWLLTSAPPETPTDNLVDRPKSFVASWPRPLRRAARLLWWAVTFQLPSRLLAHFRYRKANLPS